MNILGLMERIQKNLDACPGCGVIYSGKSVECFDVCELKSAIDALRSGRVRVINVTKETVIKAQTEFAEHKSKTGWSTNLDGVKSHWLSGVRWAIKQKEQG
jgi:hypothetical protein